MLRSFYSAASIIAKLNDNKKKIKEFSNVEISDPSLFNTLEYYAEQLVFYNCSFSSLMELNDKQFDKGISFTKCEFEKGLSLHNITYTNEIDNSSIDIRDSTIKNGLFIQNCKQKNIVLNKIADLQNLVFSNNQLSLKLTIEDINLKNFFISKSAITSLEIDKVFCKNIYFQNNHYKEFSIERSEIKFNKQSLLNSENYDEFQLSEYRVHFKDSIIINSIITNLSCNNEVRVSFTDCTFKGKCAIYLLTEFETTPAEGTPQPLPKYTLTFENNNSDQTIDIGGLDEGENHSISIISTRHNQAGYRISRAKIKDLTLHGDFSNTYLSISRLKISSGLSFLQFTGNEKSKFSNISTSKATLEFFEADFSKSTFSDINFLQFSKIKIWASQFRMATFDNIIWFTIDQVEFGELTKNSEQYHWECRRLYQQLKQSCEKNDDKHNALYFHSLEEKFHLKMLRKRPFKPEVIRLLLKSTNSFGDNWIKPIIFLLALSFISSVFLVIISGPRVAEIPYFVSIKNLQAIFSYQPYLFIQLINPTHSINEIIENGNGIIKPGFGTSLIDIIHKIFTTFLIFQTITAFRRQHT
ncbi:MAG: hypothetical protein JNM21_14955 [Taibaiella sp.]|nr:hypothetical protein [Taibaiella sp.]